MRISKKLISKKKPFYAISEELKLFLKDHDRWMEDVISYDDLLRYSDSINLYDKKNKDTLWVRLIFNESERQEIDENLKIIQNSNLRFIRSSSSSLPPKTMIDLEKTFNCTLTQIEVFLQSVSELQNK